MKKISRHIILCAATILSAIIIITLLVAISNYTHKDGGGFNRKFLTEKLPLVKSFRLPHTARSIAGFINNNLYLETDSAGIILVADASLDSYHLIRFAIPQNDQVNSLYSTTLDSFCLRVALGNIPAIYIFDSSKPARIILIQNKFTRCVQISPGCFVLRSLKKRDGAWNQQFIKQYLNGDSKEEEKNISAITNDAGISTDGLLRYDAYNHLLVYVTFYSNSITCFDTNLNLVYRARTIDTISTPKLRTTTVAIDKTGRITNNTPEQDVNLYSYLHNGLLYVNSSLLADNEKSFDFYNASVIDIYQISNGTYKGSFYLPKYKGEQIREFIIDGDYLFALYKGYVVLYKTTLIDKLTS